MSIKVRCRQCKEVVAAPDRARGKAIRCPKCKSPIRVPKGKRTEPAAEAAAPADDQTFFSTLDLSNAEDTRARLCPKCATEVSERDLTCPACHVNLDTGVVSSRMQRQLKRRGPNPVLFYGAAWKDSWRFMWDNQRLALQTWLIVSVITAIQIGMVFVSFLIVVKFLPEPSKSGSAEVDDKFKVPLLSELLKDQGYNIHNGVMALVYMIVTGWIWHLCTEVIRATLARKTRAKRVNFQFIDSGAIGVKSYVWPVVYSAPILIVALPLVILMKGGMAGFTDPARTQAALTSVLALIVYGIMGTLLLLTVPTMMGHMSQHHTFKAWSMPLMMGTAAKNIVPSLYLGLISLVMMILPIAVIGGGFAIVQFVLKQPGLFREPQFVAWWELRNFDGVSKGSVSPISFPWKPVGVYYGTVVVAGFFGSYAMIFIMRAMGLFVYYFQQRLDLVIRTLPGQLAGFWTRTAAMLVDAVIIGLIGWIFEPVELWKLNEKGKLASVLAAGLIVFFCSQFGIGQGLLYGYLCLLPLYAFVYFTRGESSKEQAPLGKEAVGIMVSGLEGERLTFAQAGKRAFLKIILFPAWIMAGLTAQKQAGHDLAAKTLVVFRGDLDRE